MTQYCAPLVAVTKNSNRYVASPASKTEAGTSYKKLYPVESLLQRESVWSASNTTELTVKDVVVVAVVDAFLKVLRTIVLVVACEMFEASPP